MPRAGAACFTIETVSILATGAREPAGTSVLFRRFYSDAVGIGTRAATVVGADSVIVGRVCFQPGHVTAGRVLNVQIVVSSDKIAERTAGGHIQPVTGRAGDSVPVRGEPALGYISCRLCRRRSGGSGCTLYRDDVGIGAGGAATVGAHPVIVGRVRAQPGHVIVGRIADV